MKPSLEFIVYVAKMFTVEFTAKMQKKQPLIHILYSQLKRLIYLLCNNEVKPEVLTDDFLIWTSKELLKTSNLLDLKEISFGENVKKVVSQLQN